MQIRRKNLEWAVLSLGMLLLLAAAAWWLLRPVTVDVVHPVTGPAVQAVYATGNVEATVMMPIAPRMGARLVALNADEGMKVHRGQVLAQLEDEDMANEIRKLQAEEEFARADYKRDASLLKNGAIARVTYDRAFANWKSAHAATDQARATAGYMKLLAPADGQIISRDGEIGQLIPASQPLFWLSRKSPLRITAEVDEEDIARVRVGQEVEIHADAFPRKVFRGQVQSITPKGNSVARSYRVRIGIPGDTPLMIGMTTETNIVIRRDEHALLLPPNAVEGKVVWRVRDGKLEQTLVTIGARGADWVEITSGVGATDQIVVAPTSSLRPGQSVRAVPISARL